MAAGTVAGTATQRWCIAAEHTTETAPGTAATTAPAPLPMVPTAPRTPAQAITHPLGLTRVVARSRTATAAKASVKRTTQGLGHTAKLSRDTMPTGAGEARRFQKTVPLHTPSIKRPLKEPPRR